MFETIITPRVSETDGGRHINNVFVPIWLEAGRREIFRILTPDLSFEGWRAAVVNINVDYLDQLYFQHDVTVRTWVGRVGSKSFVLDEEIWQTDRQCVRASATYVNFSFATQRSEVISDAHRIALEAHARESN